MVDVIIKDVPEGTVDDVKSEAIDIIERFIRRRDVKPEQAALDKFKVDVDAIRAKNNIAKKYEKQIIEEPPMPVEENVEE